MMERFKVLIVDDDHVLCRSLSEVLISGGYEVECASGDANVYSTIRTLAPDLLLLEISTPVEGRLDLLRRIQARRGGEKTPVIVISDQAELEYELLDIFDFIPKPVDEARLLEDLSLLIQSHGTDRLKPYPPLEKADLELFQDFLVTHSGLHFDVRNSKILERGLMRRMRAVHVEGYREYFNYLCRFHESRQEMKKLLGLLTVGETYFFRYLPHYEALIREIIPETVRRNQAKKTLRIWSAGCSSGEEPYSLAMILLRHFPFLKDWDVRITATDINKRAIKKAQEGVYRPRALRVTDDLYRQTYFRQLGSSYILDPNVRKMVDFNYLNLQTGVFPSEKGGTAFVDILFCRNVMIYFRFATMKKIVEKLANCIRPGGYLFLGHAETLLNVTDRFQRVHKAGGFFYRLKAEGEFEESPPSRVSYPLRPKPEPPRSRPLPRTASTLPRPSEEEKPNIDDLYKNALQAFDGEFFKTASQNYDIILRHDPFHVGALIGKGFTLANTGAYDEALDYCVRALRVDDLCSHAYFLRGVILELKEDLLGAVTEYRKALLLDMGFAMSHYQLCKVLWKLGRRADARRELDNTVRILETLSDDETIPFSGGMSRAVFMEICREDAVLFLGSD